MTPQHFLAYHQTHCAPSTHKGMVTQMRHLEAFLAGREITPQTLRDYKALLLTETRRSRKLTSGMKLSGRVQRLKQTRAYVNWLATQRSEPVTLLLAELALPTLEHTEPRALTKQELRQLFTACGTWREDYMGTLCLLSYLIPERKSDLMALRAGHFHLEHEVPHVILSASKTKHRRAMELSWLGCGIELVKRLCAAPRWPKWEYHHDKWEAFCEHAAIGQLAFKSARNTFSSYSKASGSIQAHIVDKYLSHTAAVAQKSYDSRMVIGVTGTDAPAWYGAEAEIARACKGCKV